MYKNVPSLWRRTGHENVRFDETPDTHKASQFPRDLHHHLPDHTHISGVLDLMTLTSTLLQNTLTMSETCALPGGALVSANANLSNDDMSVDCAVAISTERLANKLSCPVLSKIPGETSDEQLVEVAGLDQSASPVEGGADLDTTITKWTYSVTPRRWPPQASCD